MKKVLVFVFLIMFVSLIEVKVHSIELEKQEYIEAHMYLMDYAAQNNVELELDFSIFVSSYENTGAKSISEFIELMELYINSEAKLNQNSFNVVLMSSDKGKDVEWQYNIGTTLPQRANYDTCNLLSVVQIGDIIYEDKGFWGITGHVAVVEGVFYSPEQSQYYVRVIEAIGDGVSRSVIDCDRFNVREGEVYRVRGTTLQNLTDVVQFTISQLGKSYFLDLQKDCNPNENDWYCSELAWCAYKRVGFDIEYEKRILGIPFRGEPGVTPHDIRNDNDTYLVHVSKW